MKIISLLVVVGIGVWLYYPDEPEYLVRYYENGAKRVERIPVGEDSLRIIRWYENGQKKSEYLLVNGVQIGVGTRFYSNGQLESEANFENGLKHGLKTIWDEEGRLIRKMRYKNGKIVEQVM